MFTPLAYPEILARLVAHTRASTDQISDFNVGSVTRSWLEAAAVGLDELWLGATQAVDAAIPEAVFRAFGIERLPAAYALGPITFYVQTPAPLDILIPAGTRVRALGGTAEYLTVAAGILPGGGYEITVMARAAAVGPDANASAGDLSVILSSFNTSVPVLATNRAPILNGRLEETDAEQRSRFAAYVQSLARGTVPALEYAARLAYVVPDAADPDAIEQVQYVAVVETAGRVNLYVHNGAGQTSAALVARVRTLIEGSRDESTIPVTLVPGYRPAGMAVACLAMTDVPLAVAATLTVAPGYALAAVRIAAEAALGSMIRLFTGTFLSVPAIINTLYGVPGVQDLQVTLPLEGISYAPTARPVYGSLTLTERG